MQEELLTNITDVHHFNTSNSIIAPIELQEELLTNIDDPLLTTDVQTVAHYSDQSIFEKTNETSTASTQSDETYSSSFCSTTTLPTLLQPINNALSSDDMRERTWITGYITSYAKEEFFVDFQKTDFEINNLTSMVNLYLDAINQPDNSQKIDNGDESFRRKTIKNHLKKYPDFKETIIHEFSAVFINQCCPHALHDHQDLNNDNQ